MAEQAPKPQANAEGEALGVEEPGHYVLKRELARGGQSVIFVAHDRQMGRDVAFKLLLPGGPRDAEQRFLREARVAGQLEHPGVVPVYELGRREDDTLYCAMRLVRGRTLAEALQQEKGRARLKLLSNFVQVCQTVAYAHERGVIHRDIKPQNVMLGAFGETVLLDWGVAKIRGRTDDTGDRLRAPEVGQRFDGRHTQEGDILGTPAYMSPEQALGNIKEIDERSDVWSLGAVLYEILTGRPPFTDKSAVLMLLKIAQDKILPVLSVAPDTPRELAFICERALERTKARRYRSARELAADIEAWSAGGRVQGIDYTPLQLLRKWVAGNLPVAFATLAIVVVLAGAGARLSLHNKQAGAYLAQALLEKSEAEAHEQRWSRAAAYAAAARSQEETAEARWRAAQRGPVQIDPLWRLQLPAGIDAVAISRDGKTIAAALSDRSIRLLDPQAHTRHSLEGHEGKVTAVAFSPDGRTLVSAGEDRRAFVWSVEAGEQIGRLETEATLRDVAFSADGTMLATAAAEGYIRLWSVESWAQGARLDGHRGPVTSVDFAPDGLELLSSGEDGTLRAWGPLTAGARSQPPMRLVRGEGHQPANRAAFVPPGTVVSGSSDGTVRFFSLDGQQLARINTSHGAITTLAVPAKGAIAALGQDSAVLLVDPVSRAPIARLEGEDASSAIAVSADGAALVSANRDGRLRLWKVSPGAREARLLGAADFPGGTALAFSPAGQRVAVGDSAGHISLWDLAKARAAGEMDLLHGPVASLAFSRDGKLLAAAGHEENAYLFELTHGDRVAMEGHTDPVNCVAFSPDGAEAATGSADGSVRLWSAPAGQSRRVLSAAGMGPVLSVAYSPDGKLIAAAGEDKLIRIWEVKTGRVLHRLEGSPEAILSIAFSPHGSILASAGRDQAIRIWRVDSGKLRSSWSGHGARVWSIAFAPDGETLASASADGTIRLWDVATGRQVAQLDRSPEARALAFSSDGQSLVSTGQQPALHLVELGDKALLLAPAAELKKQLERAKLKLDGIHLIEDAEALTPPDGNPGRKRRTN
jgi:WD40 repeat protein/serine/threonine protein kinase